MGLHVWGRIGGLMIIQSSAQSAVSRQRQRHPDPVSEPVILSAQDRDKAGTIVVMFVVLALVVTALFSGFK